jgi:hypothetical protein
MRTSAKRKKGGLRKKTNIEQVKERNVQGKKDKRRRKTCEGITKQRINGKATGECI